jgi:cytochrome oxidase Cu insertion factor (SCO1/SenC/PrrC family)
MAEPAPPDPAGPAPARCWPPAATATAGAARPSFKAIDITGADYAQDAGAARPRRPPRTLADFKGKVTVVFFGFTQCPTSAPPRWPNWPR